MMLTLTNPIAQSIALPAPRVPIAIRTATMDDIPFIDGLQKAHTKQVGWMPGQQLEEKITRGHVLVAEEDRDSAVGTRSSGDVEPNSERRTPNAGPVGYLIAQDRYFKRDDVGIVYQLNVVPGRRRSLVGAGLLKAQFERSAYGCRLYCCWCAQDIEANYFWESLGFVPLAFRAGAERKRGGTRVHIFWQRRIREGDTTTPYWFPSQTTGGSIREDRLVFPIPPGMKWSDEMPRVLPQEGSGARGEGAGVGSSKQIRNQKSKIPNRAPRTIAAGGLRFVVQKEPVLESKPKRERKQKMKNDPKLVAAARELRDRWLEQVNSGQSLPEAAGKYDVSRSIENQEPRTTRLLDAA